MPAVTVYYPRDFFDADMKFRFKTVVRQMVAGHMDAINPDTGEKTRYGAEPHKFIDLVMIPYDPDDAEVTAVCLATIVTYAWPDRMANIAERLMALTDEVCSNMDWEVPEGMDAISFTFLGKETGCWYAA